MYFLPKIYHRFTFEENKENGNEESHVRAPELTPRDCSQVFPRMAEWDNQESLTKALIRFRR